MIAFLVARTRWLRVGAAVVLVLTIAATGVVGGLAAKARYEGFARVPWCDVEHYPEAKPMQDAFNELNHLGRFADGWNGTLVCGGEIMNVTLEEATDAYRPQLTAHGWTIETDDATGIVARRNGYTLRVRTYCYMTSIEIQPDDAIPPTLC